MKNSVVLIGVSALAMSATAMSAHAAMSASAVGGLTYLSQLNLIVLQNMSGGDDVEGKTFVGGSLTNAATMGIGRSTASFAPSTFATLTVGGNVSGNLNLNDGANGSIANGVTPVGALIGGNAGTVSINGSPASLIVGGSVGNFNANGATYEHNVGASVAAGIALQTATITTDLKSLSTALAALPASGSLTNSDPNNFTLTAVENSSGYAVIDITAAELATASNIDYDFKTSRGVIIPTIINVSGATSYTDNANNNNGDAYSSTVLWNFEGATSITLNRQFEGSILAPDATLSNSTDIEGSVAVASFNQGGEVHLGTFAGLPAGGAVPEPATWTMMIVGMGLTGFAIRNRPRSIVANA